MKSRSDFRSDIKDAETVESCLKECNKARSYVLWIDLQSKVRITHFDGTNPQGQPRFTERYVAKNVFTPEDLNRKCDDIIKSNGLIPLAT